MRTFTKSPIRAALQIAFLLACSAAAQSLEWIKPSLTTLPSPRCCGSVAYDDETHSTVLFGGGITNLKL
jgi:hypothetical protein